MAESVNYQCPACRGSLRFDAAAGRLVCDYCGSTYTPEEVEASLETKQEKADAKNAKEEARAAARAAEAAASEGGAADGAAAADGGTPAGGAPEGGTPAGGAATAKGGAADRNAPTPEGDPIQAFLQRAPWTTVSEENVHAYTCSSCAAQLLVDSTTAITECPYCGNQDILPGQVSGVMKPDYVIPFKVTREQALAALSEHYKGKSLLPDAFKDQNHLEHIQGVYVPFWLYSYQAQGDMRFRAERVRVWDDPMDNTMQETTIYDVYRSGSMDFNNIPADGSSKMPDAHMDSIEPYDYSELVPFSAGYLPGYAAERYDQDAEACENRATDRMENSVASELRSTVNGYDAVQEEEGDVHADLAAVHYALLPVWMLHTRWHDEDYLFAMNGQTGKMIGDLPIDKGKVIKWYLMVGLPVMIVVALLFYFFL